jgi:cell division protein FtsW
VLAIVLGIAAATAVVLAPFGLWRRIALPVWAVGVLLLVLTALFGVEVNGAQRWLSIPFSDTRFQPVELVKCATLLAVAAAAAQRDGRDELSDRSTLRALVLGLIPIGLLLLQPDLGNAVLLAALVSLVLIAAGISALRITGAGVVGVATIVLYVFLNPYAWRRLVAFWDPWKESQGSGFQLVQSFVAFSQGGLIGVGLGNGRQKLFYLPEAHTDFILALVAEELGLIGVLVVLGAFAALCVAGTRIARRTNDHFALLVAFAMTALLTLPAVVNAAVVMGLLPTKGLTLPFLSYGGTSLITCCCVLGLLLAVSRRGDARPVDRIATAQQRRRSWH